MDDQPRSPFALPFFAGEEALVPACHDSSPRVLLSPLFALQAKTIYSRFGVGRSMVLPWNKTEQSQTILFSYSFGHSSSTLTYTTVIAPAPALDRIRVMRLGLNHQQSVSHTCLPSKLL